MEENIFILPMFDEFTKLQDFVEIDAAVFSQKLLSLSRKELKIVALELEYRISLLNSSKIKMVNDYKMKLVLVGDMLDRI